MHSWKDVRANKKSKTGKESFVHAFEHLNTLFFTFNLDKLSSIAASSYQKFSTFRTGLESSRFLYNDFSITGNVKVADDLTLHVPLNHPSYCTRFVCLLLYRWYISGGGKFREFRVLEKIIHRKQNIWFTRYFLTDS